jgi:hypothetical protein
MLPIYLHFTQTPMLSRTEKKFKHKHKQKYRPNLNIYSSS